MNVGNYFEDMLMHSKSVLLWIKKNKKNTTFKEIHVKEKATFTREDILFFQRNNKKFIVGINFPLRCTGVGYEHCHNLELSTTEPMTKLTNIKAITM